MLSVSESKVANALLGFMDRLAAADAKLTVLNASKAALYQEAAARGVPKAFFKTLVSVCSKNLSREDVEEIAVRGAAKAALVHKTPQPIEHPAFPKGFAVLGWQTTPAPVALSYVYFAVSSDGFSLKVGLSKNPLERIKDLAASQPLDLAMWFYMPGNRQDEIACHRKLRDHQIKGEWFLLSLEVIAIVQSIRAAAGLEPIALELHS